MTAIIPRLFYCALRLCRMASSATHQHQYGRAPTDVPAREAQEKANDKHTIHSTFNPLNSLAVVDHWPDTAPGCCCWPDDQEPPAAPPAGPHHRCCHQRPNHGPCGG